ncbi:hypothetical protein ONS95_003895 [Cadophora gregata]|uniref:uncharacterized protein n=1 Tax=Cadophora gregata TaxID=51156 RepID=UPI0026DAA165|nr:uncharacterized protein ONS95_003895 [Cadophora gregata]KAK0107190.1 hypothetical protein ONS95_003895 [Cadophora gregata]
MGMTFSGTGAGALGINFGGCFRAYHETAHGSGNFSCAFRNLALAFFSATMILFCRNFAFISAASICFYICCFDHLLFRGTSKMLEVGYFLIVVYVFRIS